MSDEHDPELQALFAQTRTALPDDGFAARVAQQVRREIRRQRVRMIAGVVAILAVLGALTPLLLAATAAAAQWAEGSSIAGPLGWSLSLMIGIVVLQRRRVFRFWS